MWKNIGAENGLWYRVTSEAGHLFKLATKDSADELVILLNDMADQLPPVSIDICQWCGAGLHKHADGFTCGSERRPWVQSERCREMCVRKGNR